MDEVLTPAARAPAESVEKAGNPITRLWTLLRGEKSRAKTPVGYPERIEYPTMTALGLAAGDDVVWDCPDHSFFRDGKIVQERTIVRGKIVRDFSEYQPTPYGERFVELDNNHMVSTLYLTRASNDHPGGPNPVHSISPADGNALGQPPARATTPSPTPQDVER